MHVIISLLCLFLSTLSPSFLTAEESGPPAAAPLSLEECIGRVLERNPELAMAVADRQSRQAALLSARKDLFPTLSAQYHYSHQPESFTGLPDEYGYGVTAEQPLYQGRAIVTSIKQAGLALEQADAVIEQTINTLVYQTHERYYGLLRARKLEEEARQAVRRLQSHLTDARAFYEVGLIPKNDLLQSEVEMAQGEQDLVDAENASELGRARLNLLMEEPIDAPLKVRDTVTAEIVEMDWDRVIDQARTNRAEIDQAEQGVEIAANNIILRKAPYLPTVTLSAGYNRLGDEPGGAPYPGMSREIKTVKAVASWKLWTWLKDKNEVAVARKELVRAKKAVNRTINDVTIDARNSYLSLEQSAKRIKVAEKAIEHARENYRINEAQYQAQLATSTDVLDAQTLLTQAMTNYYEALYDYRLALAAVDQARGAFGQHYYTK